MGRPPTCPEESPRNSPQEQRPQNSYLEWPTAPHTPDIPLNPWWNDWQQLSSRQREARVSRLAKSLAAILAENEEHLDAVYETMRQQVLRRLRAVNPLRKSARRRRFESSSEAGPGRPPRSR